MRTWFTATPPVTQTTPAAVTRAPLRSKVTAPPAPDCRHSQRRLCRIRDEHGVLACQAIIEVSMVRRGSTFTRITEAKQGATATHIPWIARYEPSAGMDDLRSGALRDHPGTSRAYSAICATSRS